MEYKISDLVLFNDHQLLAMNKPAGIPSHDDKTGDTSLLKMAMAYCHQDVHIMTRLDRPVSGLVMMTKSKVANKSIETQREEKTFEKTYIAIVEKGEFAKSASLSNFILKDHKTNKAYIAKKESRGKNAELSYTTLADLDNYSILKINTQTGRFHQIRCQLNAVGIFIKGDVKYGARRGNKDRSIDLHAWKMEVDHPTKNEKMCFEAPLPKRNALWEEAQKAIDTL